MIGKTKSGVFKAKDVTIKINMTLETNKTPYLTPDVFELFSDDGFDILFKMDKVSVRVFVVEIFYPL